MTIRPLLIVAMLAVTYGCQSISNSSASSVHTDQPAGKKIMNFAPDKLLGKWQCEQRKTLTKESNGEFTMTVDLTLDYHADNTFVNTFHTTIDDSSEEQITYEIQKTGIWEISRSLLVERHEAIKVIPINVPDDLVYGIQEIANGLLKRKRTNQLITTLNENTLTTHLCPICTDRYRKLYDRNNLLPGKDYDNITCKKQ